MANVKSFYSTVKTGLLENLTTNAKSSFVAAINELDGEHGALSSLTTNAKSSFVAAINELDSEHGALSSLTTNAKSSFVAAINELDSDINSAFISRGNLPSCDLNTVIQNGMYLMRTSYLFDNKPPISDATGMLYVFNSGSAIYQMFIPWTPNTIFIRRKHVNESLYSSWYNISDNDTVLYNLFNSSDSNILRGQYYDRNGTLQTNSAISQTGFIEVTAGKDYTANYIEGFVLWYNNNANLIGNTPSETFLSNGYVTAIDNASYARFIVATSHLNDLWINEGRELANKKHVKDGLGIVRYYKDANITDMEKEIARNNIDALGYADIFICSKNLFNSSDSNTLRGQYYDRSGILQTNSAISQTGFIEVTVGNDYTANYIDGFVLWYDSNKNLIGNTPSETFSSNGYVTAINDASYARFIVATSHLDDLQIEEGRNSTSYLEYDRKYMKTDFYGLSGVAFGTSLTYRSQTTGGYLNYLSGLSGITFDNQGIGSATILQHSSIPDLNILSRVKSYTGYSNKQVCILEGFVNDWSLNHEKLGTYLDTGESTVCGCVRSAINYILSKNSSITLFLILDHYGKESTSSTSKNSSNISQYMYYEEISKIGHSMGIPVIKEYSISGISENTPQYLLDNIHLNTLGAKQSALRIWSEMKKYYPNALS